MKKTFEVMLTVYNKDGMMHDMARFFIKGKYSTENICKEIESMFPETKEMNYSFVATKDSCPALHYLKNSASLKDSFIKIINNGIDQVLKDILHTRSHPQQFLQMAKIVKETGLPYTIMETEKKYSIKQSGKIELLIEKTTKTCGQ